MSPVELANLALHRIGSPEISSLDENTQAAILVKESYESAIREVLDAFEYPSAIKKEDLSLTTEDERGPGLYRHHLPSQTCRIIGIYSVDVKVPYIIEGPYIFTDHPDCWIKHTAYNYSLLGYSNRLLELLSLSIANRIVTALSKDVGVYQMIKSEYILKLKDTNRVVGNNRDTKRTGVPSWNNWAHGARMRRRRWRRYY